VHPELLDPALTGSAGSGRAFWERRFDEINAYERYLAENRIRTVKFFLHISKDEQKKRLLKRLDDPSKQWKFSGSDLQQRGFWTRYTDAFQQMLGATSTDRAPWYIIPSDHKWFTRIAVADIIVAELKSLDPRYPDLSKDLRKDLGAARAALEDE
jgi:polyphosphate kinase 2 (PPK2 family)